MSKLSRILRHLRTLALSTSVAISGHALAADNPDFTGVWMAYDNDIPSTNGSLSTAGQASVDGFYAKYQQNIPEAGSYCVPPGMPSTMTSMVSYPIEFIHSENRITILAELEMQVRRVFMDGRAHPENYPETRMGHSIAVWEGDTLVIDTALLKESFLRGWPRTTETHITERIHMAKRSELDAQARGFIASVAEPIGDDALVVEMTVTDDSLYTQPRSITMYYQRIEDSSILEYDCAAERWLHAMREAELPE